MEDTLHFADMLRERSIKVEWADRAVRDPDRKESHADGTCHYMKQIPEYGTSDQELW